MALRMGSPSRVGVVAGLVMFVVFFLLTTRVPTMSLGPWYLVVTAIVTVVLVGVAVLLSRQWVAAALFGIAAMLVIVEERWLDALTTSDVGVAVIVGPMLDLLAVALVLAGLTLIARAVVRRRRAGRRPGGSPR
jgi:hypothetical protein